MFLVSCFATWSSWSSWFGWKLHMYGNLIGSWVWLSPMNVWYTLESRWKHYRNATWSRVGRLPRRHYRKKIAPFQTWHWHAKLHTWMELCSVSLWRVVVFAKSFTYLICVTKLFCPFDFILRFNYFLLLLSSSVPYCFCSRHLRMIYVQFRNKLWIKIAGQYNRRKDKLHIPHSIKVKNVGNM